MIYNIHSRFQVIALLSLLCASAAAQDSTVLKLNLVQAVETGLQNRVEVKNQQLTVQIAENEVAKVRAKNLPQVTASYDNRINTQLQRQFATFPTGPGEIKFGTYSFNVLAFNATQNIFNPANHEDKKINAVLTQLERENLDKIKIDIKLSISQAYYDALLKKEKVRASQFNFAQADAYFKRGHEQLKAGAILDADLAKLELDQLNAQNALDTDTQGYQLSLANLVNQLGLPPGTRLDLTEVAAPDATEKLPDSSTDVSRRIELQLERTRLLANELNLRKQKAGYLPTVSVYGNLTKQQLNNVNYDPFRWALWNQYNYFGFKVDVPIFDGFSKERNRQEYIFRTQQNRNNLIKLQSDLAYELQSAWVELRTAATSLGYAERNYTLARKVMAVDQTRFNEGGITAAELKNTQYSVENAQTNYLNALFNYFVAKLKWLKAKGEW